jgi:hypothetical protein
MNTLAKNTMTALSVVFVASASFYIPLKSNGISLYQARNEADGVLRLGESKILAGTANLPASLLAAVAGSTQSIRSALNSLGLTNQSHPLNIFSIEPLSFLKLQAPVFDLLPLFFSTSTKTAPAKNTLTQTPSTATKASSTKPLSQSLDNASTPITSNLNIVKKEPSPEDALNAVVNIFCSQKILVNGKVSNQRRTVTGSGTLINKDGTVLTNAHVGEFPLLSETNPNIVCLARYGNPAKGSLSVHVSYISPEWIKNYGQYINTEGAAQTGEADYALLKIGLSAIPTNGSQGAIPSPIAVQETLPAINSAIYSVSYPADILGVKGVSADLPLQKEQLSIGRFYSVGVVSNDVLETSPSTIAGQRGSSGGAIVDSQGHLIGMTTTIVNSTTASKTLIRAMTMAHISSELSKSSGMSLSQVVKGGSSEVTQTFNSQYREYLTSLLSSYLK